MSTYTKIIDAAVKVAEEKGYRQITQADVADRAGVSPPSVPYYFRKLDNLKKEVVLRAIKTENLIIIAQALVCKDKLIADISQELKERALASL